MSQQKLSRAFSIIETPYFFISWAACILLSYFFLDKKIAIYFHEIVGQSLLYWAGIVSKFGLGIYYLVGSLLLFLLFYFLFKHRRAAQQSLFVFLAVLSAGIICDILKILFGRSRPIEFFNDHLYGFYFLQFKSAMWSFPSGHATTITAVMLSCTLFYPRYWYWFIGVMLLICSSRLIVGAHFLSDIMAGMYLSSIVVLWLNRYLVTKVNSFSISKPTNRGFSI